MTKNRATVVRTTNRNGTFRYTLDGAVITKGAQRRYEAAAIYRGDGDDVYASLHARLDLAQKGNPRYPAAPAYAVAIVDGDEDRPALALVPDAPAYDGPSHNPAACAVKGCTLAASPEFVQ